MSEFTLTKLVDTETTYDNFILTEGDKKTLIWYDKESGECSLTYEDDDRYDDINEFKYANEAQTMIKAFYYADNHNDMLSKAQRHIESGINVGDESYATLKEMDELINYIKSLKKGGKNV